MYAFFLILKTSRPMREQHLYCDASRLGKKVYICGDKTQYKAAKPSVSIKKTKISLLQ
jgi:hypothetical protein